MIMIVMRVMVMMSFIVKVLVMTRMQFFKVTHIWVSKGKAGYSNNMAKVRNCPDVAIIISLFGLYLLVLLSSSLFVFLSFCCFFCLFVILSFCLFVHLSFCLFSFCLFLVFLSRHHSDQMSEGSPVSKVTPCVKILKWHPVTHSLTKVRYRAARAAKN